MGNTSPKQDTDRKPPREESVTQLFERLSNVRKRINVKKDIPREAPAYEKAQTEIAQLELIVSEIMTKLNSVGAVSSFVPEHDPQPVKSIPYDYSGRIEDPDELNNILPSQASIINALAKKAPDRVNAPSHYTSHPSGVECIDITEHYDFCVGNAIKYLWRAGLKAEEGLTDKAKEIEDLRKAAYYITRKIKQLEK